MAPCKHSTWLSARSGSNVSILEETNRLAVLLGLLRDIDEQYPALVTTIGQSEQRAALRTLFGSTTKLANGCSPESVHLYLDPSTAFADRPWLLAEARSLCLSPRTMEADDPRHSCHRTSAHLQPSPSEGDRNPADVHARLLQPFTNVICVFASDLGGLAQTSQEVAAWMERCRHITSADNALPALVIVTDRSKMKASKSEFLSLLRQYTSIDLKSCVCTLRVLPLLPRGTVSNQARFRPLKELLQEQCCATARRRARHGCLFSARHLAALLEAAVAHSASATVEPFDIVRASRATRPVSSDLNQHMANIFSLLTSTTQLDQFAGAMLASCLFLDSYPPDSHLFKPTDVFSTLYADSFDAVCPDSRVIALQDDPDRFLLRAGLLQILRQYFEQYFAEHTQLEGPSAKKLHRANLQRFRGQWGKLRSERTCLCCAVRTPQYALECGHMLCETCVVMFGEPQEGRPYLHLIRTCPLCWTVMRQEIRIRVHPPTAGVSILCIDGGGARGIVPLTIMQRIQDRIDLPIPFQRFFKLAFGVSSGGLIIMNMFLNGSSIEDSARLFHRMATTIFTERRGYNLPLLSRIYRSIATIFSDGLYQARDFEQVLKGIFHPKHSLLGASFATTIGAKIGLPVATVHTRPACRVFTNYNGTGTRAPSPTGEPIIRTDDGLTTLSQWKIARAISAAPGFFPAAHIDQVGTFQDAGPLENNPVSRALSEMHALFPHVSEPDFVLSLGTGEPPTVAYASSKSDQRGLGKSNMFTRTRNLILEKMRDGTIERVLKRLRSTAGIEQRIHRLNVQFKGPEPRLDNASCMASLASLVRGEDKLSSSVDTVARAAVASLFYFELDRAPQAVGEYQEVAGCIRCVLDPADLGFDALLARLRSDRASFSRDGRPLTGVVGDRSCYAQGTFCKKVGFLSRGTFTISLHLRDETTPVSGSPFSLERLVKAQGFDAHFGRADHRKRKASHGDSERRKKQKQRIEP